jgi:hypothetical protein
LTQIIGANGNPSTAAIEVKASPPPTAQTSLLLNFVELGKKARSIAAKQNSTTGC